MSDDQVSTVIVDLADMAIELEGARFYELPVVYQFGGGRKAFIDPGENGNLYNPPPDPV